MSLSSCFRLSSFLRLSSFSYLPILHTVWNISLLVVGCRQPAGICLSFLSCLHFWGCLSFLDCLKLWSSPFLRSSSFLWLSSFLRPFSFFTEVHNAHAAYCFKYIIALIDRQQQTATLTLVPIILIHSFECFANCLCTFYSVQSDLLKLIQVLDKLRRSSTNQMPWNLWHTDTNTHTHTHTRTLGKP